MAEETNEWELAQDFSSNEGDIKKKNTEKSPLIFQTGSTQSQSLGSDGLGTSKIDTWESALTPEQKKSFVPIKEEPVKPKKKTDLSEFLPKLPSAAPSTTSTKIEVQPVSGGRDTKIKVALNDVTNRISKDSPIVQQYDNLEADLLSSKEIIDDLTKSFEQEQDPNKKQEIGLKLNDIVQDFNTKLPEYQKIGKQLQNDYALYSSLNKGYEALKKLPELEKDLKEYKRFKDDYVANFIAGLYNTAVPGTLKAVGSLVNLTGDLGESYSASLANPHDIAQQVFGGDKEKLTDNLDKSLRGLADDIEIKLPDEIKKLTSYNLGSGTGSTLSILGTSLIGGGAAGVATGFGLSFDSIKEESLKAGYSEKEANLISGLISLPVAALDQIGIAPLIEKYGANRISNALFKRVSSELAGKELTKETISKSVSKGISDILMDEGLILGKEMVSEGVTESIQSGVESSGKAIADVIKGEDKFKVDPKQAFKDALVEGGYGLASTGIIGAPGAAYQGVSDLFSDDKTLYSEIKKLSQDEDYYNRFTQQLEVDVKLGKKTQEDVDNILDNIKAVAEIESKLPASVKSDNKRIQAISLVRQKQDLQEQLNTADDNFKPAIEAKIKDTQDTINKITTGQALTDEDILNSEYSVSKDKNGIPVFNKFFDGDTYEITREVFEKEFAKKQKLVKDKLKEPPTTEQVVAEESVKQEAPAVSVQEEIVSETPVEPLVSEREKLQKEYEDAWDRFQKSAASLSSGGPFHATKDFADLVISFVKLKGYDFNQLVKEIKQRFSGASEYSDAALLGHINDVVKQEEAKIRRPEFTKEESKEIKKGVKNLTKETGKEASKSMMAMSEVAQEIGWKREFGQKIAKMKEDFSDKFKQQKEKLKTKGDEKLSNYKEKVKEKDDLRKAFKEYVDDLLSYPSFRKHINNSNATLDAIAKRVNNIKTQKSMDAFADYLVKLAEDGKYNEKLEYAESNQKNIDRQLTKKLKKEIPFDLFELLKELSSINPNRLSIQDLEDYIRITDNMKDGVYPKIKDGIITLGKVNQNDIKKFVEPLRKEEISSQFKNPLLSEVNRLISKHGDQSFNINGNTYNGFMELGLAQVSGEISTEEYIEAVESVMKNMTDDLKSIANGMKNKISGMVSNIDAQQDIINKLSNADIDLLTDGELLQYINTTQQIYDNNNFNGARKIADIANGSSKIQDVKEIAPEVRKTVWGRKYVQNFFSLPMMYEAMTKSLEASTKLMKALNVNTIISKSAEAKTKHQKFIHDINEIIEKWKKKGVELDSPESNYTMAIISNIFQFNNPESDVNERNQEYKERLLDVYEDVRKHREGVLGGGIKGNENQAKADLLEKVLSNLGITPEMDYKKAEQIVKDKFPGEYEVVTKTKESFADNLEMFKDNTEIGNNRQFKSVYNYGPTLVRSTKSTENEISEIDKIKFDRQDISRKQVGSSFARTGKGKESVYDYNFLNTSSKVLLEQLLDSHIQRETTIAQKILNSKEVAELLGNDNVEMIKRALVDKLNDDYRTSPIDKSASSWITKKILALNNRYIRVMLGSANQVFKQYAGVVADAAIGEKMGKNVIKSWGLDYKKDSDVRNLLEKFPIGERIRENPLFNTNAPTEELERAVIDNRNKIIKSAESALRSEDKANKAWGELILTSLKTADNYAAMNTWIAAYAKKLEELDGTKFDDIDWKNESEKPNQDAADYAEQVISRTQYVSDTSLGSAALKSKSPADALFKNLLFPLATFTINNKNRILVDLANIKTDPNAMRRVISYGIGIGLYNLLTASLKELGQAGADNIAKLFGFDPEKDDKSWGDFFSEVAKEFALESTIGGIAITDEAAKLVVNTIYDMMSADEIARKEQDILDDKELHDRGKLNDEKYASQTEDNKKDLNKLKEKPFKIFDKSYGRGNVTVALDALSKAIEKPELEGTNLDQGVIDKYNRAFNIIMILDVASALGWSEGTLYSMSRRVKKSIKSSLEKQKKEATEDKNALEKKANKPQ